MLRDISLKFMARDFSSDLQFSVLKRTKNSYVEVSFSDIERILSLFRDPLKCLTHFSKLKTGV